MDLLAAEITARTGKDPGEHYRELTAEFGTPYYTRIDAPATPEQKARLAQAVARGGQGVDPGGRADHRQADPRPGQRRPHRRPEGRGRQRLVRGPAVRHGEHLQDLRRELQGREAPGRHRRRGPADREQCPASLWSGPQAARGTTMSDNSQPGSLSPFPPGYRASGVLLHVTSLPSPYGIGDVGPAALAWVDRLHEAGQSWWQALPLGPTGYGNSPYQCLSSFAGNGLLISPDWLIEDGLLRAERLRGPLILRHRRRLRCRHPVQTPVARHGLEPTSARGARPDLRPAFEQFCHEQAHWLEDYALFRALKVQVQRRPLPRVAGRAGPAQARRPGPGPARAGAPDRSGVAWHNSCCSARGNA